MEFGLLVAQDNPNVPVLTEVRDGPLRIVHAYRSFDTSTPPVSDFVIPTACGGPAYKPEPKQFL